MIYSNIKFIMELMHTLDNVIYKNSRDKYYDKANILNDITDNISIFVSDNFSKMISLKVKQEVENAKEKFLKNLNICEEEYPIYDESIHLKFKGNKINRKLQSQLQSIDTENEYIFTQIIIGRNNECKFYLTNKGNIFKQYQNNTFYNNNYIVSNISFYEIMVSNEM